MTTGRSRRRIDRPALSLFSNCGAGDLGYATAGFDFEVMAELERMRLEVAALNHPGAAVVCGDLRDTWRDVVRIYQERRGSTEPALLAACPPCQGMSSARSDRGKEDDADAGSRDDRNLLVGVIARVTHALRPDIVVVENVQAFLTRRVRHPHWHIPVSAAVLLVRSLRQRYEPFAFACDLADYGIPQTRKRAFLAFVRRDLPAATRLRHTGRAPFPRPTHADGVDSKRPVSLDAALASLGAPALDAGDPSTTGAGLHSVPLWDEPRYRMVAAIPPNSGRGAWENDQCLECGHGGLAGEAVACSECGALLPRPIVDGPGGPRLVRGFHTSSYTRMRPDDPAATVTTASGFVGSDKTIHPSQNRVLSPLECAHLQTFPPDFRWGDAMQKYGSTNIRAMIGEAVPPQFTQLHGEVLAGLLTSKHKRACIAATDVRVARASQRLADAEAEFVARLRKA